ncbi:9958_t:CDS:2, partial [Cetraspora pellucida]
MLNHLKSGLKKIQKIKKLAQVTEIESDEFSSQVFYSTASPPSTPLHISLQHESQEQFNQLRESEDSYQNNFNQLLKAPVTEILSNTIAKSNAGLRNVSWVWDYMKKDKLKKQVTCEVVTLLDGNSKKCNRTFSITTSTTHLGEHLNAIHRIFSSKQYKKNSQGQTIIESNKSIRTIPSMLLKLDPHKPAKQEKLVFHLIAWIVEDYQPMTVVDSQNFRRFCYEMDPRFKVPGSAQIKTKIKESLLFAEDQLHMWTSMHRPYIGVTIHWLSKNFDLYQAVLTIEEFPYSHSGDHNDKSIVKGMRLLETPHIRCTAHTIQLAIKDGLNVCDDLLTKAKKLNNWLVKRDRYRQSLRNIQNELNQLSADESENLGWPLLGDYNSESDNDDLPVQSTSMQPIEQAKKKKTSIVEPICDKELDELILLLLPFAQSTKLIGGAQYPTLSMMLPTISLLSSHLRHIKSSLISPNILNICQLIEDSMSACWETPLMEAYITSYLDPRFKNLSFVSNEKKKRVLDFLSEMINTTKTTTNTLQTEMDRFYDGETSDYLVNNELEQYEKVMQINKYFIDEPRYKIHNPLTWWCTNQKDYPNLAALARKYLSFLATSVPSEQLFSNMGNVLTQKRNQLDPNT